jgi:hypothetical protein
MKKRLKNRKEEYEREGEEEAQYSLPTTLSTVSFAFPHAAEVNNLRQSDTRGISVYTVRDAYYALSV